MILGKRFMAVAIIFSFIVLPLGSTALADDVHGTIFMSCTNKNVCCDASVKPFYMTVDLAAARPLGIASTILGASTFIVSSPFSALGNNFGQSFDTLVKKPFMYSFKRPLGIF